LPALVWLVTPAAAQPSGAGATPAQRQARRQQVGALWDRITVLLDEASAAHVPARVPPMPVPVRWQAKRVASIPLDAPLLALAAGDLDGDARDELVALTAREVVILGPDGDGFAVRARAALPAEPAAVRPRTPVGTLVVHDGDGDGRDEVAARSSEQARGVVLASQVAPRAQPRGKAGPALEERGRAAGFPLCAGVLGQLEPGRHEFAGVLPGAPGSAPGSAPGTAAPATAAPATAADSPLPPLPARFWSARCSRALVDPAGRGLAVAAVVAADGTLTMTSSARCAAAEQGCPGPGEIRLAGAGVAFEIADLDRDGHPEIAVTRAAAPGDPDEVEISTWSGSDLRSRFRRGFTGGVVGLAAGDFHGRGAPTLIGAVRLLGSHRVDLWSFNDPT
jgi:hypothetical protein